MNDDKEQNEDVKISLKVKDIVTLDKLVKEMELTNGSRGCRVMRNLLWINWTVQQSDKVNSLLNKWKDDGDVLSYDFDRPMNRKRNGDIVSFTVESL